MSLSRETVEAGVQRLRMRNWRGTAVGYEVSAYLLDDVLVDTGFAHARASMLEAVDALRPRGVIVTHSHEDHAGNVPALAATGLPMVMHDACEAELRAHPSIRLYRRVVWGRTPTLGQAIEPFDASPLAVVAAPGHSGDHLVVWDAERRILVSGSRVVTATAAEIFIAKPWATDDIRDVLDQLQRARARASRTEPPSGWDDITPVE